MPYIEHTGIWEIFVVLFIFVVHVCVHHENISCGNFNRERAVDNWSSTHPRNFFRIIENLPNYNIKNPQMTVATLLDCTTSNI